MWKVEIEGPVGVWTVDLETPDQNIAMARYNQLKAQGKKVRIRKPTS